MFCEHILHSVYKIISVGHILPNLYKKIIHGNFYRCYLLSNMFTDSLLSVRVCEQNYDSENIVLMSVADG